MSLVQSLIFGGAGGSGGGNSLNKGFYLTPTALTTQIPIGEANWYASVASTGTYWGWNGSAWVDTLTSSEPSIIYDAVPTLNSPNVPRSGGVYAAIQSILNSLSGYATDSELNALFETIVASAPTDLNTLEKLATAVGDDPDFATTILQALSDHVNSNIHDQLTAAEIESLLDTYYGGTSWREGGTGTVTGAEIEEMLDVYYGSTAWRTGGAAPGFTGDVTITKATAEDVNAAIAALPKAGNGYSLIIQLADGNHTNTIVLSHFDNLTVIAEAVNALSAEGDPNTSITVGATAAIQLQRCNDVTLILDSVELIGSSDIGGSDISILKTGGNVRILEKFCKYSYSGVQKENFVHYGIDHLEVRNPTVAGSDTQSVHMVNLSNATDNNVAGQAYCYDGVLDEILGLDADPFTSFATGNGICAVKNSDGVFIDVVNMGSNTINLLAAVAAAVTTPAITFVGSNNITPTGVDFICEFNRDGAVYYGVYPEAANTPTSSDIEDGTGAVEFGTVTMAANVRQTTSITGLSNNSGYSIYYFAKDSLNNVVPIGTISITTNLAPVQLGAVTTNILVYNDYTTNITIRRTVTNLGIFPAGTEFNYQYSFDGITWFDVKTTFASNPREVDSSNQNYYFRTRAEGNETTVLSGPWTAITRWNYADMLTSPAISNVVVGDTHATVTWNDPNANENGYTLCYHPWLGLSNRANLVFAQFAADSTSGVITGLLPETAYRFEIFANGDNATTSQSTINAANAVNRTTLVSGSVIAPTVTTQAVTDIAETTATGNGNITNLGGGAITAHGIVYVEGVGTPTLSDTVIDNGTGVEGAFTAAMTGLIAETLYTVRAYATNSAGTSYGDAVTVTTSAASGIPTLVAPVITAGTPTDNTIPFTLSSVNDGALNEDSIEVWIEVVSSPGYVFQASLPADSLSRIVSSLTPETAYNIRVRAMGDGITKLTSVWSNVLTVETLAYISTLTVTTQPITNVTATTATGNGNITDLGIGGVTAHGIAYSETTNVVGSGVRIDNGAASATGAFTCALTGLTEGTLYYTRAFATNGSETVWGGLQSFVARDIVAGGNHLHMADSHFNVPIVADVVSDMTNGVFTSVYSGPVTAILQQTAINMNIPLTPNAVHRFSFDLDSPVKCYFILRNGMSTEVYLGETDVNAGVGQHLDFTAPAAPSGFQVSIQVLSNVTVVLSNLDLRPL